jgi:hypothetical protein
LLPLGAGVETIVLLGHRLDIFLAYFLVYFSLYTAVLLLLFGVLYLFVSVAYHSVLDPRISYETLRQNYADDAQLLAELESSKSNLQAHYNMVYAPTEMANSAAQPQTPANGSPQKVDFLARYRNRGRDTHTDELAEYFRITSVPEHLDVDPLHWWYGRRHQFPDLYRLVPNVLCIPGTLSSGSPLREPY